MIYIQRKGSSCQGQSSRDENGLETVDEFETRKEAREMLKEYQTSERYASYYLSSRCCKAWKLKG